MLGFTVLFVLFLQLDPTEREFFVPAGTDLAVKLLKGKKLGVRK